MSTSRAITQIPTHHQTLLYCLLSMLLSFVSLADRPFQSFIVSDFVTPFFVCYSSIFLFLVFKWNENNRLPRFVIVTAKGGRVFIQAFNCFAQANDNKLGFCPFSLPSKTKVIKR